MKNSANRLKYLRGLIKPGLPALDRLWNENLHRNDVQPSVEPETGRFLELLVRTTGAKLVLELGTSNGYSSMWILKALKETDGRLVTIDSKERLHLEAVENFREAGFTNVSAIFGDAGEELKKLEPGFDIIFQDCGKYLYPQLFEETVELLKPGGLLVADDTLFSFEPGVRPNLGKFTDQYNELAFGSNKLLTSIIPIGHGLTLSFKL